VFRRSFMIALAATPLLSLPSLAQDAEPLPDFVLGDPEAAVEVIEYASFSCIHCANFHNDVYPELKANYIDTGKIRFVYREFYLNKFDLWAGMLARCAGERVDAAPIERGYFAFSNLLFTERDVWLGGNEGETIAGLYTLGRKAGMTDEEMTSCVQNSEKAEALVQDFQLKAGGHAVRSTPTFIVDGVTQTSMSYAKFSELLDAKLN